MKPTVEFILKSFHNSGKRHLLLTGARGCGKTTRFNALAKELMGDRQPGITTYAVPGSHVMLRDNLSGREAVIGQFNGQTMILTDGLWGFGVEAVERLVSADDAWVGIDELGYLESGCSSFQQAVPRLFDSKHVLAVVRKQDTPFLNSIMHRSDVFVVDVEETAMKIGCVIMASGMSKRFGSNKLVAEFRGKALMEHILDTTEGLFHRRVVVTRSGAVVEICNRRNADVILHEYPGRNDVVRLGTEYLRDVDALVFCPCDQPLLRRASLQNMLDFPWIYEREILRMGYSDTVGAPIMFGRRYYDALCTLPEKKGGGYLAKQYPEYVKIVQAIDLLELFDVDTPEDLQQLNELITPQN